MPDTPPTSAATKRTCPVAWCWKAEPCPDHAAKPATTAACSWCVHKHGRCTCMADCGVAMCAGERNGYIESEDCR